MDGAWVDKFERRFGFLALPGLPGFLSALTAVCAALSAAKPEFISSITLDPSAVLQGEVWRVFTFMIVPPQMSLLWMLLWLAMIYSILKALESAWGDFKLTVYLLIGLCATACASLGTGSMGDNSAIHLANFLAFARLAPEREVLVMFVLPVKLRWIALLAGTLALIQIATSGTAARLHLIAGLAPYFLYFAGGHWRDLKYAWRQRGFK